MASGERRSNAPSSARCLSKKTSSVPHGRLTPGTRKDDPKQNTTERPPTKAKAPARTEATMSTRTDRASGNLASLSVAEQAGGPAVSALVAGGNDALGAAAMQALRP